MAEFMESFASTGPFSPWEPGILSLAIYGLMVFLLVVALLFLSSWPGEKKPSAEKMRPYECGVIPTATARFHYPIAFYLIAAFFLIFDVEVAYIFTWAIAFDRLGWAGWCQVSFFIILLLLSLFYIWKKGGLEWGPTPKDRDTRETSS